MRNGWRHNAQIFFVFFASSFCLFSQKAYSFSLTPMSVDFEPQGKEATKSFLIDNSGSEKIAVQISMAKRQTDLDGNETNPDADDEFIVYPPQLILNANEKRTVRVTWAGTPTPKSELAFRIIAEQLPVETEKREQTKNATIKVLLKYKGAVYIVPKNATPALAMINAERIAPSKTIKTPQLRLTIENRGTTHKLIKDLKIAVSAGGKRIELANDDLKPILGQNMLAGTKRRFSIAWPTSLPTAVGGIKVELTRQN